MLPVLLLQAAATASRPGTFDCLKVHIVSVLPLPASPPEPLPPSSPLLPQPAPNATSAPALSSAAARILARRRPCPCFVPTMLSSSGARDRPPN